jgi:hypothetical protein
MRWVIDPVTAVRVKPLLYPLYVVAHDLNLDVEFIIGLA